NAVCSTASLERSWREASAYARTRLAFGQPIARFPTLARILAHLRTQAYAARGLTFFLMDLSDRLARGEGGDVEAHAYRMLVNFNKFWTAQASSRACLDAIEVLGGNGAIEEFSVLPRLLRDSIVCEAWEGGHNVLCAQALKDAYKLGLHVPMFELLEELAGGEVPEVAQARDRFARLLAQPPELAAVHIRDVAEEIRFAAQSAALAAEARTPGSDPLLATVVEHHRLVNARGYDPLDDPGLAGRVDALVS
ncbi:MAG: hypothetical protein KC656_17155, partial [Myxococcales bacterium]|nr:hypothetical protein [Myxococcales bacterium]